MNIVRATVDDVPRVETCAAEFCAALGWPLDRAGYLGYLRSVVENGSGALLLLEDDGVVVGGIGGTLQNEPVSGHKLAVELFWFVQPKYRGTTGPLRLLAAYERWGQESGADHICMISMENSMPEEMDRLYRRLGYRKLETTYIK